ncbi:MAG: 5-(carboxyamino)imidazole ribonucleotide synthase [Flavobacteriaceae bacterium]|nr:5-(carboxyamino)imidazole ribonucleotide synthase [Flavobacteriaceae bacterium]
MQKIGILGGGQLGMMFIQNALSYPVEIHVLDPSPEASCAPIAHRFVVGDFNDYDTVMRFAQEVDIVGIEIEHVNLQAMKDLKAMGKKVIPDPDVLEIIQDKGLQKEFYLQHNIPTAPMKNEDDFPVVQKLHKGGYDGKGVKILTEKNRLEKFDEASVFEELADIALELAVIVARNEQGETAIYPVVEQVFNPTYNLLDYLLTPARIDEETAKRAQEIALKVVNAFQSPGIFAVELFLNKDGEIWVNETAPRVHNSGHSTIEAAYCSQFDMMLRVLMNYPLGSTQLKCKSAMLNIIGAENQWGEAEPGGLDALLGVPGAAIHWYAKKITQPGRKMGHATFVGDNFEWIISQIEQVRDALKSIEKKV